VPVPKLEQLIPLGVLVTTPIPPPAVLTVTSSNPGTNPTQPIQVMTDTATTGIRAFPNLDILLPSFTGSHFDEKAAELVGFQLCFQLRMASALPGIMAAISSTCAVMLISE